MHKAVDNCMQAPAHNAVKMGGEKMTSRSWRCRRRADGSNAGKIGKVIAGLTIIDTSHAGLA
ncbi:hypothetical protein [Xanthomonas vesicatoria]|uniref:hypothetical protein n=1 Tax=Xanthomonas vesicatoria TaxID=56460 RepID=UPI0005B52A95|nr:hypothetical protein [Xanthomonas vesicatoria]APP74866.1 hypothetical protein BJD12_05905 [Xanthomonas vesicatoria ATCC 35937]KTF34403.1 hypothetical protein LMG920_06315 [Xanthomonas vesicatoria]MCC8595142.1 hypothetical protein [Xanthomonas vesicatoria]MCC8603431.1 hypothetical protein [Xanthomonas vesicatoria]MCC8616656.1 hypothetical protein [Xanthomonas vesicatoria]